MCGNMDNIYDFEKICRSCLKENVNMQCVFDVTISEENQIRVIDFLGRLSSLKISEKDGLPENICMYCIEEICKAYNFAQQYIANDYKLKLQKQNLLQNVAFDATNSEESMENEDVPKSCNANSNLTHFELDVKNGDSDMNNVNNSEFSEDLCDIESIKIIVDREDVDNNYKCLICNATFCSKQNLLKHKRKHDSGGLYKCSDCNKTFSKLTHLKVHSKSHMSTQTKRFNCEECGEMFNYLHLLKQHSYKHKTDKPFPCSKCSKGCSTAESLRRHMKIHDENYERKVHTCEICCKEFPYPSFLAEHMKNHTGEKPFLCSVCGKGFRQKGALQYHVRIHTGVKPYSCNYCEKQFTSQGVLRVHMRKHTNERPYICDVCGVGFRQSTDLKSHHRTHTGDKPVLCTICGKRMATTGQLTVHLRTHTGEKPFSCTICTKAFATRTMLVKHERIHTGERPYACHICGKAFNQSGSLKTHSQTHKVCKDKDEQEKHTIHLNNDKKIDEILIDEKNCLILDLEHPLVIENKNILLPTPVPMLQHL